MTRRLVRHVLLLGFVIVACIATLVVPPQDRPLTQSISLGLGYASFVLLIIGLLIGPWTVLRGGRPPVSTMLRRDVGVWAAFSGGVHVLFGLQSHMGGQILHYFTPAGQPLTRTGLLFLGTNWLGLAATMILVGLLLLSNNWSLRKLGARRWKLWQRSTYAIAVLTLLHTFGYQALESRDGAVVALVVAASAAVVLLQMLGCVRMRRRSSLSAGLSIG